MNRNVRILIAVVAVILAALVPNFVRTADPPPTVERRFPELGDYADLYLRGSYDILHMIRVRELEKVGRAAKIAAERKMAGGTVWSAIGTPHIMYAGACTDDMPGNPGIAPDYRVGQPLHGAIPELGAGDFLVVAGPGRQEMRRRGCFFLGIGYPMSTNRYSPPDFNDHPSVTMESQVDLMIYTWGPKEDGLVTPALTPHLKICPTSPMTVAGYWLFTAQLAHNLATGDTSGTHAAAEEWLDRLMYRLSTFHERSIETVHDIAPVIADRIQRGGKLYPWSSRWEFYHEAQGTAGSIMGVYPIHPEGIYTGPGIYKPPKLDPSKVEPGDMFILAVSGDTPEVELEMARTIRARGAYMVGIFPFEREDGFPTEEMRTLCDVSLDNLSGDMWGVLDIPGYDTSMIPTATLMNNYAFWSIIAAYVQEMERRNDPPYYWMSWHVPGGKAYDDSVHAEFLKRGY